MQDAMFSPRKLSNQQPMAAAPYSRFLRTAISLCACGFVISGCSSDDEPPAKPIAGHNVLFITLDTTRADRIGTYGYPAAATPVLDALAKGGTAFDRAYSQVPLTLPSHASLLTGRYPREFGVRENGRNALPAEFETLAETFQSRGYRTGAFVSAFVLDSRFGLDQGFDVYDDHMGAVSLTQSTIALQRPATVVTDSALGWLRATSNKPFFCWIHYYDPHDPYEAPPPFAGNGVDPYDAEIAYMDSQIGRVMKWLQESGQTDRTLVVAVGDHGESHGEHGVTGHTMFLFENITRVPLILSHPTAIPGGRRIGDVVEIGELYSTVLELMGWPVPGDLITRSLSGLLRGQSRPESQAFSESNYAFEFYNWSQQRSLVRGDWKYIASAEPALYNVRNDPGELVNLINKQAAIAGNMHRDLLALYESLPEGQGRAIAYDPDGEKALMTLGYLSGGTREVDEFLTPGLPEPLKMLPQLSALTTAQQLMQKGEFAEAAKLLEPVAAADPNSYEILAHLGTCYLSLQKHDQAEITLKKATDLNHRHQLALMSRGDLYAETGRLDEAVAAYTSAASAPAPNPQVLTKLTDLLVRMGRTDEAFEKCKRWLDSYPDFAALRARYGVMLAQRGELDTALGELATAAKGADDEHHVRPQVALGLQMVAAAAGQIHDSRTAAAALEELLKLEPQNQQALQRLESYYLKQQQTTDAIRVLRIAAEPGNNPKTMTRLAYMLATSRNDAARNGAEAVRWAERAMAMTETPRHADLAVLAAAYAEAGQFAKAIEAAERAIAAADQAGDANLAGIVRGQMEGYRQSKPFRDPQL